MPERTTNDDRDELFHQQALVLKALANASRLKLVDRLVRGPCAAGELASLVDSDRTTVSKHLGVLRAHGIVRDHREAGAVVYQLRTPCVANVFACTRKMLEERAVLPPSRRSALRAEPTPSETNPA
jgi:DNA-binding transcriptional ArsR family regulator